MKREILFFLIFGLAVFASGCREKFDPFGSPDINNAYPIDNGPASIKILSPRAGDSFQTGDDLQVRWLITGDVKSLKIQLYRNDDFIMPITFSATENATLTWFIPPAVTSSNSYRIKVVSGVNSSVFSFSDTFTIVQLN